MSEAVTKQIKGVCEEISERGEWTTFSVDVGSQYPVKLSTKLQPLIELGRAARGQEAVWTFKEQESDKINEHSGKPYINRYLDKVEVGGALEGAAEASPSGQMTKEEWARKDSAIHKMACIKTAADALKHTVPADPSLEDLNMFLQRVTHLSLAWHRQVLAERDDPAGEDIPFD